MIRAIQPVILAVAMLAPPASGMQYQGKDLEEVARASACYLLFVRLYEAAFYRDDAGGTQCVRVQYQRPFTREELAQSTRVLYEKYFGADLARRDAPRLTRLVDSYEDVEPGDRYSFCVSSAQGGALLREGVVVLRDTDMAFSRRVLGLWVAAPDRAGEPGWRFSRCG